MEAKIEEVHTDQCVTWLEVKMEDMVSRMDDMTTKVEENINKQGLGINSMRRGMEQLYELNKREEESIRNTDKKVERYKVMLRRILDFYQDLEVLNK